MSRDLADLHPVVLPLCVRHQKMAADRGLQTAVIETFRDDGAQAEAWSKGRDARGNVIDPEAVVTWKRPGASWHNIRYSTGKPASFAYHLAVRIPAGLLGFGESVMDEAAEDIYSGLAWCGEQIGLTAGARWKMRDWTHFEFHPDGATHDQVIAAIAASGDIHVLMPPGTVTA